MSRMIPDAVDALFSVRYGMMNVVSKQAGPELAMTEQTETETGFQGRGSLGEALVARRSTSSMMSER